MPQRLKWFVAGLVMLASFAPAAGFCGGTGGNPQVPNLPEGRFSEPGAPGLCQCTAIIQVVAMSCPTSARHCESLCQSRLYAFVPDAGMSCPVPPDMPPPQPTS